MGGSYGGYATLVGLTFTPDDVRLRRRHRRPVRTSSPCSTPSRPTGSRSSTCSRPGSVTGPPRPARRAPRAARPSRRSNAIKVPLLIGQGANDPRVNAGRIGSASSRRCEGKKIPVTYVLFPDEGHGFARPENNLAFFAVSRGVPQRLPGRQLPAARRVVVPGLVDHGALRRRGGAPAQQRAGRRQEVSGDAAPPCGGRRPGGRIPGERRGAARCRRRSPEDQDARNTPCPVERRVRVCTRTRRRRRWRRPRSSRTPPRGRARAGRSRSCRRGCPPTPPRGCRLRRRPATAG